MSYSPVIGSTRMDGGLNRSRKFYRKPVLEKLGDLRTMTLGGSPGTGDSGNNAQFPYAGDTIPPFPLPDEYKPPEDQYFPPL